MAQTTATRGLARDTGNNGPCKERHPAVGKGRCLETSTDQEARATRVAVPHPYRGAPSGSRGRANRNNHRGGRSRQTDQSRRLSAIDNMSRRRKLRAPTLRDISAAVSANPARELTAVLMARSEWPWPAYLDLVPHQRGRNGVSSINRRRVYYTPVAKRRWSRPDFVQPGYQNMERLRDAPSRMIHMRVVAI